ncbi:[protein-PII] uridylyltransferase [Rhodoblastus acidophilus]|uniref:Bifunctional uridylyltransferase/uridylyl-removing enzyme n=1 Tax=Candidatus Rhodoblastus alkanivorans TaxID=2954117 RepID=A0ABS9Z1U4_9HYPH|nr:[protein-PII] uridylyltransferase [Candidatus Rhodoblastus alkanivorans]MCI4678048.1 [protein-PII] uridylyltransferase [Candidatus Rhodoblastus alkanivorans]MCI4681611.1 [protein-PII] uridylyltransferase [Candidatus Rhodoblastus alkanivorans]MDI4642659.1 [protein-PII] uridylyltransferase [Rhodoblastus acidophilus]
MNLQGQIPSRDQPAPKWTGPRMELPMKALFDRAALDARISGLAERFGGATPEFRKAAVEVLAECLAHGARVARAALENKGSGLACGAHLAFVEDEIIRAIYCCVAKYILPTASPPRLCVVAVGGYGRGALAPGSDIDLLFLLPSGNHGAEEAVVESMLYLLWDLKQKVGHATRTVEESLRQAKADMTIRTTLLECRFVLGDRALLDELLERFDQEIVRNTAPEFVAAKLSERDARIRRAGASRYLVEPNVKEGKGGLRDLNTLFWIAKYVYRVQDADALVGVGLFTEQEWRLFRRCEAFLWKVRCFMHFMTGHAEERLSFELQRQIAAQLDYAPRSGLSAVERFMKHYFTVAKSVGDLTNIVCAALEERQAKPRAVFDRFVSKLRRRSKPRDLGPFALETDRVTVPSSDVFDKDPVNLIRLFQIAARNELPIHPDALRLVTQSLPRIDNKLRADPEANRLFLDILTSPKSCERALRLMNEAGVLGRFIPDFGRIVAMMQFNMYHHYTVDEHLLRALGELAAVDLGQLTAELPLASAIMPTISHRRALYVAVMLHDIAKGRKEDHSIAGVEIARRLGPRLGLTDAETEAAAWLVEYHLTMSNIAQSRDLGDSRTIEGFAKIVQTVERLKMLLVLTACDIRAVGPGVWNGWKAELMRTLYWETELVLAGGHSSVDRKRRVQKSQAELREKLPGWSDPEFADYAARHYPAYWLKVDLPHRIAHARLLHATAVEMNSLATEFSTDAFRAVTEITVVAPDHPRLLSIIAGACAASGANIVDAQIFTTTDGLALDTICVSRAFDHDEDELRRGQRIARSVEQALRGEIRLSDVVAAKTAKASSHGETFSVPPDVIVDNSLSHMYSVVEVSGLDRPGLLYDLTFALSRLNLNIASAHIVTFGEKAVDTFYVSDITGAKVVNPARQAALRRNLLDVFGAGRKA